MVGRVPENLREGLREALIAIGTQDGARLVGSFKTLDVLLPGADLKLIERASMQVFDRFGGMSMGDLRDIDPAEMMRFGLQFRELMLDLPFQLPENLLLLGRSVAILSGMCTGLDPRVQHLGHDRALRDQARRRGGHLDGADGDSPRRGSWRRSPSALPGRADRVLTIAERGELNVQTPVLNIRVRRLERALNRANAVLVFAAVLIAGALVMASDPILGRWLMGGSAVPLLWAVAAGRRRRPGPF